MRRLILLRHAKTEIDAPTGQDQDRRLDDRGRLDAAAIGGWIGRHPPYVPDAVLVSPAVRTRQTWEIVREAIKTHVTQPRVEFPAELYGADPAQLLQIIRARGGRGLQRLDLRRHQPWPPILLSVLSGEVSDTNIFRVSLGQILTSSAANAHPSSDWRRRRPSLSSGRAAAIGLIFSVLISRPAGSTT